MNTKTAYYQQKSQPNTEQKLEPRASALHTENISPGIKQKLFLHWQATEKSIAGFWVVLETGRRTHIAMISRRQGGACFSLVPLWSLLLFNFWSLQGKKKYHEFSSWLRKPREQQCCSAVVHLPRKHKILVPLTVPQEWKENSKKKKLVSFSTEYEEGIGYFCSDTIQSLVMWSTNNH